MRRLSIFRQTFRYSFLIMLLVIFIAHGAIWLIVPRISVKSDVMMIENGNIIQTEIDTVSLYQDPLLKGICISFSICIIIVLVLSYLWAGTTVRPIKEIENTTKQMTGLIPGIQCNISPKAAEEFKSLSNNINELYNRLFYSIEQLKKQIQRVDESDRSKIDFLRAASHELKTPLTACNAMLENMILKIGKYKDYERYLPECKSMIDKMGLMIQDMLNMNRLRNGIDSDQMSEERVELRRLIEEVSIPFEMIAKARQIEMIVNIKEEHVLLVKEELFKRALSNVIMNAVTYTYSGKSVEIICVNNTIIVSNEGKIIKGEELNRIFDPFFRLDDNPGGNGLGLYIVDTIFSTLGIYYTFSENKRRMMEFAINIENIVQR